MGAGSKLVVLNRVGQVIRQGRSTRKNPPAAWAQGSAARLESEKSSVKSHGNVFRWTQEGLGRAVISRFSLSLGRKLMKHQDIRSYNCWVVGSPFGDSTDIHL